MHPCEEKKDGCRDFLTVPRIKLIHPVCYHNLIKNVFFVIFNFGAPFTPKDLKGTVENIAQFLERSLSDDVIDKVVDHCTFANMKKNPMASVDSILKEEMEMGARRENKSVEQLIEESKLARPFMRKGEQYGSAFFHTPFLTGTISNQLVFMPLSVESIKSYFK